MTHHEFEWFAVLVELTIRMVGRSPVQCLIHHAIYSGSICFLDPKPSIIRTHFPSYRKLFASLNPIQWTLPQLGTIASKNVTLCHACILMAFNISTARYPGSHCATHRLLQHRFSCTLHRFQFLQRRPDLVLPGRPRPASGSRLASPWRVAEFCMFFF